jgi:hypothetical protein
MIIVRYAYRATVLLCTYYNMGWAVPYYSIILVTATLTQAVFHPKKGRELLDFEFSWGHHLDWPMASDDTCCLLLIFTNFQSSNLSTSC